MRTILKSAFFVLALACPALAEDKWTIDPAHTSAGFGVRHLMVSTVRGAFGKVSGTITFDPKDLTTLKVDATIDATTVETGIADRDTHLKSADFFDVAKFPTMKFLSKKCEVASPGKLKLTGELTLHGVTKEVVLDVEGPSPEVKDPWGNVKSGAVATARISRKEFGLTWNKVLEAGGVAVGDEVSITIDIEATKEKPAEKKDPGAKPAK